MSLRTPVYSPHQARPLKLPRDCWLSLPEVKELVAAFEEQEAPLRFVGGAVRDALLGRRVQDIDAATPLPPQKVMSLLEEAGIRAIPTGISHGTVTALIGERHIEITTLRRDVKTHGRHADVQFTDSWEEDAKRRDFTMNALYCDPGGTIHDYSNGVPDAQEGIVRFIGDADKRVKEDALRILRFFRFTAWYSQSQPEPEGLQACKRNWALLENLSGERVRVEMFKLLESDRCGEMLQIMARAELTESLFPPLDFDILHHWPKVRLMADAAADAIVPLALLLRGSTESQRALQKLRERWKLSNRQQQQLAELSTAQSIGVDLNESSQKRLLRKWEQSQYERLILISWVEHMQHEGANRQLLAAAYRAMLALAEHWHPPVFPITGEDLISLGIEPSPQLGEWLEVLENYWESANYEPDRADLLAYAKHQIEG